MLLFTDKHQKADTGGWRNYLPSPPTVPVPLRGGKRGRRKENRPLWGCKCRWGVVWGRGSVRSSPGVLKKQKTSQRGFYSLAVVLKHTFSFSGISKWRLRVCLSCHRAAEAARRLVLQFCSLSHFITLSNEQLDSEERARFPHVHKEDFPPGRMI